jgi:hypothetical protein
MVATVALMATGASSDSYSTGSSSASGGFVLAGFAVEMLGLGIFMLVTVIYSFLISPALNYLYIKKGLSAAFAYGEVFEIIKKNWLDFLIIGGLTYAVMMVLQFAGYLLFCIIWLIYPIVMVIVSNAIGYLYGQKFAEIDKQLGN